MKNFYLLFGLLLCQILAGGNLLRNADFTKLSPAGLPREWDVRKLNVSLEGKTIRLQGSGLLVQEDIKLAAGETYILSYEVRGDGSAKYRLYCEWGITGGPSQRTSSDLTLRTAGKNWSAATVSFVCGKNIKPPQVGVVAIQIPANENIEFRNLKLEALSLQNQGNNLLKNADFAKCSPTGVPYGWEARKLSAKKDNNILVLKDAGVLIQSGLPLDSGKKYLISWEIRSKTDSKYRIYCEWTTKTEPRQFRFSGAPERQANGAWKKVETSFTYEKNCNPAYLAVSLRKGAEVELRNLKLEAIDMKKGSGRKFMDGEWFVTAPSRFMTEEKREMLLVQTAKTDEPNAILRGIKLESGKNYTLTYKVKSQDSNPNASEFFPYRVKIVFAGSQEKLVSPWDDTWSLGLQGKTFRFKVPENVDSKADIELYSGNKRAIFFDDFELKESQEQSETKHPLRLMEPHYRNTIYASMPIDRIKGKIKTGKNISKVVVRLEKDGRVFFEKAYDNSGDELTFAIPAKNLEEGTYCLSARPDQEESAVLELRKLPKAPVEVVMGSDKLFRINGKTFFPAMFWGGSFVGVGQEEQFHALARNGVNMVFAQGQNRRLLHETLDHAARNGIKVIVNTKFPKHLDEATVKNWTHNISNLLSDEILAHPALFGYFIADEPMWGGVPLNNLLKAYELLKKLDPYRPTWINAAPRGTVAGHQQYSRAADIYGVDIYPVGSAGHSGLEDKTLSSVGKYVLFMDEAVSLRKPVWMVLQGFAWQSLGGADNGKGYPSPEENRFVIYDSLVEGAQGIVWWGMAFVKTASFYDTLFAGTRELHAISGLLVNGKEMGSAKGSEQAIRTRVIESNGKKYMIAVNGTPNRITAVLNPEFSVDKVIVFQENRFLPVKDGAAKDTFEPYSVHVYGEAELPAPAWPLPEPDSRYDFKKNPPTRGFAVYEKNTPYEGNANWIWEETKARVAGSETTLKKEFELDASVKSASMIVAVDDQGAIRINDKEICKSYGFIVAVKIDAAGFLKVGKNTLSATVADSGQLPCGLLIDLMIELVNGKKLRIVSDGSWQSENRGKVTVIAPYGKGAWGSKVKVPH